MSKPFGACLAEIEAAAGRSLTDSEMSDLAEELALRQQQKLALGHGIDQAAYESALELANDMQRAAIVAKRNTALNLRAKLTGIDFIRSQFAARPDNGVEALLVGINSAKKGSRASVAAEQEMLKARYGGGFVSDMEHAGRWQEFVSGAFDRDIARALWAMDTAPETVASMPKTAVEMATVIRKWQEVTRIDANAAGADIAKMPGYIVRQSHDVFVIRAAGFEAWKAEILPRLDLTRTFADADNVDKALQATYDALSSGIHLKAPESPPSGFKGPRNLAKSMSAERVLHFKSADDWFDYNAKFGTGNLREAVMRGFEMSGQNTGIMRKLGPNPEATFNQIVDGLALSMKNADPAAREKFKSASGPGGYLRQRLSVVDGTARIPVNRLGAQIASGIRATESMAKLGGAVLSSVTDMPSLASELRYQGSGGYLSGIGKAVAGLFKGRNRREMAEVDGGIGVFMDGMKGQIGSRFSVADDGVPGTLSKLQRLYFKFNGLTWWTDTLRASAIRSMAHIAATRKGTAFAGLHPDFQRVLGLYGIDGPRWDIIRQAVTKEADGRSYLTADAIRELPDSVAPARMRNEVADQYLNYLVDRGNIAVLAPDARNRAIMTRGSKPGTIDGELLRFIGQFKSFAIGFTTNIVGRELYGRGADTLGQALRNGNGEMLGLAQLILWSTVFGYAAMSAKDIFKGKQPRDPLSAKTWLAAMSQGGGFGIYGDFLFGEMKNRFGGTPVATLAGPTLGTIDDIADLWGRVKSGDKFAAAAIGTLVNNTPFANLFYTRVALDYLILYRISESLSPGYLRRLEKRTRDLNAQEFLVRPSQAVGH